MGADWYRLKEIQKEQQLGDRSRGSELRGYNTAFSSSLSLSSFSLRLDLFLL
jgi:hypothetical protein